jgi:hypothetical protein
MGLGDARCPVLPEPGILPGQQRQQQRWQRKTPVTTTDGGRTRRASLGLSPGPGYLGAPTLTPWTLAMRPGGYDEMGVATTQVRGQVTVGGFRS